MSIWILLKILIIIVPILIAVAFLTLVERKVIASMQRRKGPNVVGFLGLLQPFADALKLLLKELIIPSYANKFLFIAAPLITFVISLMAWAVIPFNTGVVLVDINVGLMYLSALSGLAVYGIILSGWSSNSNYAFLGALRSAAQMVSYEVSLGLILMNVLLITGSLNLTTIVACQEFVWFALPLFPLFILYFLSILAETNRHPFDLPEAEAELVAGYNVEYSAMSFALFFIGEYGNMIVMSALTTILFLGGWSSIFYLPPALSFGLKILFLLFIFIWLRAGLPRYRYDQLMRLGWKVFLPLSLGLLTLTASILYTFQWLP